MEEAARPGAPRRAVLLAAAAGAFSMAFPKRVFATGATAPVQGVTPHALAEFFQPSRVLAAALAPSGERIAVVVQIGTPEEPHRVIDLLRADNLDAATRRIDLGKIDIEALEWANDERLLVRVAVRKEITGRPPTGSLVPEGNVAYSVRRLLSVDAETGENVVMFETSGQGPALPGILAASSTPFLATPITSS